MAAPTFETETMTFPPGTIAYAQPPAQPTPRSEIIAALRTLPELEGLGEHEYLWIAERGTERFAADGGVIFVENTPSHHIHFILRGEVQVHRRNSGPVALFMGQTARVTGKLPFSRMKTWGGDGCASGEFWGLDLHEDHFPAMLQAIPSMTERCVHLLVDRVREFTRADEQAAKLIALGKLAANLAHELNNPASAARRAAGAISSNLDQDDKGKYQLGHLTQSEDELLAFCAWTRQAWSHIDAATAAATPLTTSEREDELMDWLETREIPSAWTIAPVLAEAGLPTKSLDALAATVSPALLPLAVTNFAAAVRAKRAASTIVGSTARIFEIVAAIKDYSYMDQAPIQDVNVAQSLESTLAMLQSRLEHITVERDYDPNLPPIRAFGSELNQVWMALIENALDAMRDRGTLRLTTRLKGRMIFVEVWDQGPGIESGLKSRIFEPFFTTKPPGMGLGLGLDLVQRVVSKHFGSVSVESKPGATCFQVRLPLDRMQVY